MHHEPKQPRTNWQTVDYVIDSLLDRGLQPVFTTSFIPSAMSSGPLTVFSTRAHTSPPRDWAQWEAGTCGRGNLPFRDPLNKERRFIPLRLDDAPIKGSLAQLLYINSKSLPICVNPSQLN